MMDNPQNSDRRFIYFYFNRNEPEKVGEVVRAHVDYWKTVNPKGYMGGPFADRTGGLISFTASSMEEATEIILQDPFILADVIDRKWIKEWVPE
ncbi:MAG TPA: YciI family protein [Anaerolineales bacterium]